MRSEGTLLAPDDEEEEEEEERTRRSDGHEEGSDAVPTEIESP
jgi:hypothetical protein